MNVPALLRPAAARPAWTVAAFTALFRAVLVMHALATNPLARTPQLDAHYYLEWAHDIVTGDLLGVGGIVRGRPWFLNPLYAYLLAPVTGFFEQAPLLPALLLNAALGATTAGLTAGAVRRHLGPRAAWIAGALVCFSAPLAQLDAHVSVAELAAVTVAGACWACAPAAPGDRRAAHGPVAAALWLGIGALARPITPLALPLVAWRYAREAKRPLVTVALMFAVFGACAVPSWARNRLVSGEGFLYTGASGMNLHLGNNPESRAYRGMTSPHIRFSPIEMHDDGRRFVHEAIGRAPTWAEVNTWFTRRAVDELLVRAPGASALFYANKARWFFHPTEVPSSASFASDRSFTWSLHAAFVPTWILACLAAAGAWALRRRREILLGPGALALAHWVVLTMVFPLSHYRAPAVPALAVLATGALLTAGDAWREGRRRAAGATLGVAALVAGVALVPPGPDPLRFRDEAVLSMAATAAGDLDEAERRAYRAMEVFREQWDGRELGVGWELIGETKFHRREWEASVAALSRALEISPEKPFVRCLRSRAYEHLGDFRRAETDARWVVERYEFLPDGHLRLGELLSLFPERSAEARAALVRARERGLEADPAVLRRVGLR